MFVNFPRWGDPVEYTVAEVRDGKTVPFPDLAVNKLDKSRASDTFVSVQSVVVDDVDRLWVLDTGSINFDPHALTPRSGMSPVSLMSEKNAFIE